MALRDQPYLPLYVQDYLTDEKLNMCSASTQGIYIKIMCLFHKSDPYGGILLKQKDKQNENICLNFALKFARLLPFDLLEIKSAMTELLEEKVLLIDGDFLFQKRMVKDNDISNKRSKTGREGGKKTQNKNKEFAKAKVKANTEYESDNENGVILFNKTMVCFENFRKEYKGKKNGLEVEYKNFIKKNNPDQVNLLLPALLDEIEHRQKSEMVGSFIAEWKNLSTWINQKCWLQELPEIKINPNGKKIRSVASRSGEIDAIVNAVYDAKGLQ